MLTDFIHLAYGCIVMALIGAMLKANWRRGPPADREGWK